MEWIKRLMRRPGTDPGAGPEPSNGRGHQEVVAPIEKGPSAPNSGETSENASQERTETHPGPGPGVGTPQEGRPEEEALKAFRALATPDQKLLWRVWRQEGPTQIRRVTALGKGLKAADVWEWWFGSIGMIHVVSNQWDPVLARDEWILPPPPFNPITEPARTWAITELTDVQDALSLTLPVLAPEPPTSEPAPRLPPRAQRLIREANQRATKAEQQLKAAELKISRVVSIRRRSNLRSTRQGLELYRDAVGTWMGNVEELPLTHSKFGGSGARFAARTGVAADGAMLRLARSTGISSAELVNLAELFTSDEALAEGLGWPGEEGEWLRELFISLTIRAGVGDSVRELLKRTGEQGSKASPTRE